jgi:hypothetical protein
LQSHLESALKSQQIATMEAAILVLGAIGDPDGAYGALSVHSEHIIPFLMQILNTASEIMCSTTIWTLSKFTDLIVANDKLLQDYISHICQRVLDND